VGNFVFLYSNGLHEIEKHVLPKCELVRPNYRVRVNDQLCFVIKKNEMIEFYHTARTYLQENQVFPADMISNSFDGLHM